VRLSVGALSPSRHAVEREREFFIDNLLVRIHFIIVMIRWTGLAPWEFEFPFPGSREPKHGRSSAPPPVHHGLLPGQNYHTITQHYYTFTQHYYTFTQNYYTFTQHYYTFTQHYYTFTQNHYAWTLKLLITVVLYSKFP